MNLIEKVAAAMAEATNGGKWDDGHYCEDHKALWMKRSRAAIEAMREPTQAMIDAADVTAPTPFPSPDRAWEMMIDAALESRTQ